MSFLAAVFNRSDLQREMVASAIAARARRDGADLEGVRVAQAEWETLARLADLCHRMSPLRAAWEVLSPTERSAAYSPTTPSEALGDDHGASRG